MVANRSKCSWWTLLQETFTGWSDDRGFRFAAALAYYAVFSITPLLIICISLAGFVFGEGQARTEILDQFGRLFGPKAATEIETLIVASANQARSGWATLIGIVTLLLGASAVFAQLKDALNTIWGVRLRSSTALREFVRDYLVSFAMVLAIGFLLTISLVLTTALQAVVQHMSWLLPKPALTSVFAELCSFLLLACLFGLIYKVLPDVELEWRDVRMGALVTGFLFTAGKYAISFYLASSSVVSSFGAAGALILLLLWIYYSAVIFFFGAEFTKTYSRHCRGGIQPEAHATFVTREMKVEQGVDKHS